MTDIDTQETDESPPYDAVILAGGLASPQMALRAGTTHRALFPYKDTTYIQWVYEAVRGSQFVDRIAVVGPEQHSEVPSVCEANLLGPEMESIDANLFGALARLLPEKRVL